MTNDRRGDEPDEGHIPDYPEGRDFDVDVEIDIDALVEALGEFR